jgi:hypothetical protein
MLCRYFLSFDFHLVRAPHRGAAAQDLDPGERERAFVERIEARDLAILVREQRAPVEMGLAERPAESRRDLEILAEMRRVREQLLGNAADVDAGAAEAARLGDRDARAVACGDAACADAAGSASYGEEVVVEAQAATSSLGD